MLLSVSIGAAVAEEGVARRGGAQADFDALKQKLEAHGWRVKRTENGDLELRPPGLSQQAPAPSRSALPEETPPPVTPEQGKASSSFVERAAAGDLRVGISNLGVMQSELRKRGWEVREEADGSLILKPLMISDEVRSEKAIDVLGDLRILLKAAGWQVDTAPDGSLYLYPNQHVTVVEPEIMQVPVGDLDRVKSSLEAAGWRVHRDKNGSLVVLPAAKGAPLERAPVEEGVQPEGVAASVKLPVDNVEEARKIASAWLQKRGDAQHVVGKIRKVRWIYVVSIVDPVPPYRLRQQIVVRVPDGKVVPLF